jgi:hypothetical protein
MNMSKYYIFFDKLERPAQAGANAWRLSNQPQAESLHFLRFNKKGWLFGSRDKLRRWARNLGDGNTVGAAPAAGERRDARFIVHVANTSLATSSGW